LNRFAHLSDIHLGSTRDPILREMEINAFEKAMNECIDREVDFIIISGDFFDTPIPDLEVVNRTLIKLKEINEKGIPIYIIYGSHDYAQGSTSIIDLLCTIRLMTKIDKDAYLEDGNLKLTPFIEPKTGIKIVGFSARKQGLEKQYYERIEREYLENLEGLKIFMFHSSLDEFKPQSLSKADSIPISLFPKEFDYYAGGHVHNKGEYNLPGYSKVTFPGPLFTSKGRDLEDTAKGVKRGFFIINFDTKIVSTEFIEITNFQGIYSEHDVSGKTPNEVQQEIKTEVETLEVNDKVIVLKIKGELSGGKVSDINFSELEKLLITKKARYIHLNRNSLVSKENSNIQILATMPNEIEEKLFEENINNVKSKTTILQGEQGIVTSKELLRILEQEKKAGETNDTYENRVIGSGKKSLLLE